MFSFNSTINSCTEKYDNKNKIVNKIWNENMLATVNKKLPKLKQS